MMNKRKLTKDEIDTILDFIKPRDNIPSCIENNIIARRKQTLIKQLENIEIYPCIITVLKKKIKEYYIDSLIQPGECVGIISAQSIGELGTQATLNNFHVAGYDTGSTSGIIRLQEIINANKTLKIKIVKFHLKYPLKDETWEQRSSETSHLKYHLTPLLVYTTLNQILHESISLQHNKTSDEIRPCMDVHICCILSKKALFRHKILPHSIAQIISNVFNLDETNIKYSNITDSDSENITMLLSNIAKTEQERIIQALPSLVLGGICGITDMTLIPKDGCPTKDETFHRNVAVKRRSETSHRCKASNWVIQTNGGTILEIANIENNPFDMMTIYTNDIWDIYNTLGIEATRRFIVSELVSILPNIQICHVMLLADRMTYSGVIEPMTRYTMRKNETPLHRASFEESFETFLKAARLEEMDPLKGVSATIMTGKKAPIGTNSCDIFYNPNLA